MKKNEEVCSRCGASDYYDYEYARRCRACWQRKQREPAHRVKARRWAKEWRTAHPAKALYWYAKRRARNNGLVFDITTEDIHIPVHCPVLGIKLGTGSRDASYTLDRLDNTRGYVKGNVRVISYRANRIKNDATAEELEKVLRYVRQEVSRDG